MSEERDTKIRTGYRVIGPNTCDGQLHSWFMPSREMADNFAKQLARDTGAEVDVCKYVGSWRIVPNPVEFIEAKDE